MRIISGKYAGHKLSSPKGDTRPTLDRVRESLFNIIRSEIKESTCLDLFAGSGAIGLELLSRGAKYVYFCEKNIENFKVIKKNISALGVEDKSKLFKSDYKNILSKIPEKLDIIFLDPPYNKDMEYEALDLIKKHELCNEDTLIIVEATHSLKNLNGYTLIDERKYGTVILSFLKEG